ncbi:hypothetical protein HMPREF9103_01158 [Lentilactobacillus parafarraginis F0439]|uniref:Uncharacterized protein n=1 Tax=Lentilactobacillus parafarraginis F0439 TaxID=797515 RepID=G9ZN55_9LACO|nr:hypothetical protein HMPREF9103_01158 [Lentilactobacillus parafarraginis F0439]
MFIRSFFTGPEIEPSTMIGQTDRFQLHTESTVFFAAIFRLSSR